MTALARVVSSFKRQTRPLVRVGAPHEQTRNCLTVTKFLSWTPDGGLTPSPTGRPTTGRNVTMTLTLAFKALLEVNP
jgi:hypothetical protein